VNLVALGLNHTTAPLEVRERLAFSPEKARSALRSLPPGIDQALILSTCNRTEVYAVAADSAPAEEALAGFLGHHHGLTPDHFIPYCYYLHDADAMRHLFRVVCGVDSMVLGEDQIQGQVRRALGQALAARAARRPLSILFRRALEVGKRVRRETLLSRHTVSVSHVAVMLAQELLGDLSQRRFLIVSAGETGKLSGKIIRESGARDIVVVNRTLGRARRVAERLGGRAVPFGRLPQALAGADVVISATGAPGFVLTAGMVAGAMSSRQRGLPLLLIDLAVPRDIDPGAGEVPGVHLYNIDGLQGISQTGLEERRKEAVRAEAIVDEEVHRAVAWWRSQRAVATIVSLRRRAEQVRQQELSEALRKLSSLTPQQRAGVEALSRAIVNKLLHPPTVRLRDGSSEHIAVVEELFRLKEES
jgi:glutamyl-tRNA reductase